MEATEKQVSTVYQFTLSLADRMKVMFVGFWCVAFFAFFNRKSFLVFRFSLETWPCTSDARRDHWPLRISPCFTTSAVGTENFRQILEQLESEDRCLVEHQRCDATVDDGNHLNGKTQTCRDVVAVSGSDRMCKTDAPSARFGFSRCVSMGESGLGVVAL